MIGRTAGRRRMTVLLLIFVLFGAAAMARLAYWQVIAAPELVERALGTMTAPEADAVARADITDRHREALSKGVIGLQLHAGPPCAANTRTSNSAN